VTLLGIVTLVMLELLENAELAMLVTGYPFVVAGMFTVLEVPVQPVIVIVPLLVVKVNCAKIAAGNPNTSNKDTIGAKYSRKPKIAGLRHMELIATLQEDCFSSHPNQSFFENFVKITLVDIAFLARTIENL